VPRHNLVTAEKELAKKGLLKPKNFTCRGGKIRKVKYILTKKGFEEKLRDLRKRQIQIKRYQRCLRK